MRDEIQEQLRNENEMRGENEKPKHTKQIQTILRERLREIKALHATSERDQNTQKNQRKLSGELHNQWRTANTTNKSENESTKSNRNENTKSNQNENPKSNHNENTKSNQNENKNAELNTKCENQGNKLWIDRSLMGDPLAKTYSWHLTVASMGDCNEILAS